MKKKNSIVAAILALLGGKDASANRHRTPAEVQAMLGELDEAGRRFNSYGFSLVRDQIEEAIRSHPDKVVEKIRSGISPRQAVYSMLGDIAGDMVESGQYHIYRGVLNPMGPGEDLLRLYEAAEDEMVTLGIQNAERASRNKEIVRHNIRGLG